MKNYLCYSILLFINFLLFTNNNIIYEGKGFANISIGDKSEKVIKEIGKPDFIWIKIMKR